MVTVSRDSDGLRIGASGYRLWLRGDRPLAVLDGSDGEPWAELALVASVHARGGLDETVALDDPIVETDDDAARVILAARSSFWEARRLVLECREDALEAWVEIEGSGELADVHLFGGYSSAGPIPTGWLLSRAGWRSLFTPEPAAPDRAVLRAGEPAAIDVTGTSLPGRGHWFFTPPPFCFAASRSRPVSGMRLPPGPWMSIALASPLDRMTFTGWHLEAGERAFWLRLAYEGQTEVEGAWRSPSVVFSFDAADPFEAIDRHVADLRPRGFAPRPRAASAAWWREPIFCGWGAQCHLGPPRRGSEESTQVNYDTFLADLEAHGVRPRTVVIDDRWQTAYGIGEADPARWPDLRGWIERRHRSGQRVLLWWKAWDPGGLEPDLCIRNAAGRAVAADPSNPAYREALRRTVHRMLSPDGYDADGLKVDFTADTPSGPGLSRHGPEWGVALLHRLLETIYAAAKEAKPDALIMAHAPNPAFADVADMVRLNDLMRLGERDDTGAPLVEHMQLRARVARAAVPELLIDSDDWALPDRATWRRYLSVQPTLGVPSLYYTTHIDRSGEALGEEDYAAIREAWGAYRAKLGSDSWRG